MVIDYESLGTGIYELMLEEDQAVVSIGMIPLRIMDIAVEAFRGRAAKEAVEIWGLGEDIKEDLKLMEMLRGAVKEDALVDFQKNLTVAIFGAAKEAGSLIV